jgi:hypothetical protein
MTSNNAYTRRNVPFHILVADGLFFVTIFLHTIWSRNTFQHTSYTCRKCQKKEQAVQVQVSLKRTLFRIMFSASFIFLLLLQSNQPISINFVFMKLCFCVRKSHFGNLYEQFSSNQNIYPDVR